MLAFVVKQIGVDPALFADYAQRDQTRRKLIQRFAAPCSGALWA